MLRMMIAACLCLASMPLAGCATTADGAGYPKARTPIDLCQGADVRRSIYTATIAGVDAARATGRAVPSYVILGGEAASVALSTLNLNCPLTPAE